MSGYIGSKRSSSLVSATEITLDGAKLKSSGDSITKSDGTTAVLSESSGTVTFTTNNAVIEGSSSGDLVRITQTGSGNALVVEDSTNPDSTPFVIDASGKLLVGTSTARSNLFNAGITSQQQVETLGGGTVECLAVRNANDTTGADLVLAKSRGTAIGSNTIVQSGDRVGTIAFMGSDGSEFVPAARINAEVDGTPGTDDMPGRLVFLTTADGASGPSERMRIDSSGNVGIGTSSPDVELTVDGQIKAFDSTVDLRMHPLAASNVGIVGTYSTHDVVFYTNASERMRIDSNGNVGIGTGSPISYQLQLSTDSAGKPSTNTWTIVSDERIKENIELADLDLCYNAVKNIPLKRFKWRDEVYSEEQVADRHKIGWIAQDVEAVYPKAVNIHEFRYNQVYNETIIPAVEEELDEDGNVITEAQPERTEKELVSEDVIEDCHNLNADQIYAAMYGAIQKLIEKVESQQSQIDTLTTKTQEQDLTIASLISRIEALETQP